MPMSNGLTSSLDSFFVDRLPSFTSVSDDFVKEGICRKAKHNAVKFRHIQPNAKTMLGFLCFDVDSPNGLYQWYDNNCLAPNWVTVNPENGHAHYVYAILNPVSKAFKSKAEPQLFAQAVNKGMVSKLGSDRSYSAYMTKNPLHDHWDTYTIEEKPYNLDDLADNFPLIWDNKDKTLNECGELGRHQTLFETGRFEIYRITQQYRSNRDYNGLKEVTNKIFQQMNNDFAEPLPFNQVRDLAKCVANWCYRYYKGDGKNRGVMQLQSKGHLLSATDKQSLGASYSHTVRKQATEQKIIDAVAYLKANGKKVNCSTVSTQSKLNKAGVTRNYKGLIDSLKGA